jgi:hypothetical protein
MQKLPAEWEICVENNRSDFGNPSERADWLTRLSDETDLLPTRQSGDQGIVPLLGKSRPLFRRAT